MECYIAFESEPEFEADSEVHPRAESYRRQTSVGRCSPGQEEKGHPHPEDPCRSVAGSQGNILQVSALHISMCPPDTFKMTGEHIESEFFLRVPGPLEEPCRSVADRHRMPRAQ